MDIVASMKTLISANQARSIKAQQAFVEAEADSIVRLVEWTVETFRGGGKLLIFGNGGSAADAQHLAAEFVNRFKLDRAPLPALALTTDTSVLTSIGNDYGFDQVFAKQVQALGRAEDLALAISTSGNSENIVQALRAAGKIGMRTVGLTGGVESPGGRIGPLVDLLLNVPSGSTPHIQETHLWLEHVVCDLVEQELFGNG